MAAKSRPLVVTAFGAVALLAFLSGRYLEERTLAAKIHAPWRASVGPSTAIEPPQVSYRQLTVEETLGLPFADFYEALRSAPGEAREKWASELAAMPESPRRTAAVSAFYKLLVQFDPDAAVEAIRGIEDVRLQNTALGAAVNAAPGFAMRAMAELSLSLEDRTSTTSNRDYLSDVLLEWMLIDSPAVARFVDEHPQAESYDNFAGRQLFDLQFMSVWAAVDPTAAKQWIDRKGKWEDGGWEIRSGFIDGWYENDRAAAVSYALAHAQEPEMGPAIAAIVRNLYSDSKEEAAKFIEDLPENKRPDAFNEAFRRLILLDEDQSGDARMTPQAIASWMTEFPPAYWKGALGSLFSFSSSDAADMVAWIEQQPPSLREAVAAEYTAPFENSPSDAIMPVLRVADPALRDQLLRALLKNGGPGFDETRATIASAQLSSEQKNHLFQIIAAVEAEPRQN